MKPTIEAEGLAKSYRSQVLFARLKLRASPHERLAIIGPSGVGKTTLLNLLATFDKPDAGLILSNGINLTAEVSSDLLANYRQRQGFVSQEPLLIPDLTAKENVLLPMLTSGRSVAEWSSTTLVEFARKLGVESILGKKAGLLSAGEKKRVELLRAVVKNPDVLIADEPTANLDETSASVVVDVISQISDEGTPVVFSFHRDSRLAAIATSTVNILDYQ